MQEFSGQAFPTQRLRRLRYNPQIRQLCQQNSLSINDLIQPLFIAHGENIHKEIPSMPGVFQFSLDNLKQEIDEILQSGLLGVILFGIPEHKDATGAIAANNDGIIQRAIRQIKRQAPKLLVISDVCCCEYTDHGHCGVVNDKTGSLDVDNDATLPLLAQQAISHAEAGADMVAPSGMMDGMVATIRQALDVEQFIHIPILSYAAKYSSALYGPFREAADFSLQFGSRQSYQMDPANGDEALREVAIDLQEGADMLMVKPALAYLDVIYRIKQAHPGVPLAAYQVSGEYAMQQAAFQNGWLDEKTVVMEMLLSMKRAGADFVISYYAKRVANWIGK